MKKLTVFLAMALLLTQNCVLADGMVYDPSEYPAVNTTKSTLTNTSSNSSLAQDAISEQSTNFNNALFELDSAQVNIRNELLEYKAKYQEVDTQYQLIKEQRKVLNDQINSIERRIKAIERSKNHIRKTMI
ncbi:MAG: hypothetical protein LUG16_07595 [Candidatus Gastranaerophilales bacterium]|nr:hypothetical protein [Candidatus Gastranaerophilales bacterium]